MKPAWIIGSLSLAAIGICTASVVEIFLLHPTSSTPSRRLQVRQEYSSHDEDADGINDTQDLLDGARAEVRRHPIYHSGYYRGGYPPEDEGVCTDLIWRALRQAGYDLKESIDEDIRQRTSAYPRVQGEPDPNIDFRRVPNVLEYLRRYGTSLTTEIKPWDEENLKEWQGGDIVVFGKPKEHIAIISDKRRADGVPFIIHNSAPYPAEQDALLYWDSKVSKIVGHFRWR